MKTWRGTCESVCGIKERFGDLTHRPLLGETGIPCRSAPREISCGLYSRIWREKLIFSCRAREPKGKPPGLKSSLRFCLAPAGAS